MEPTVRGTINEALLLLQSILTADKVLSGFILEAEQALRKAKAHVMRQESKLPDGND